MQDFETEEQQVQAIKKWFSENAVSLFLGLGIGLGGLFGWRYYIDQQNVHLTQASEIYQSVVKQMSRPSSAEKMVDDINTLVNEYADTPYASLASLALARHELQNNNIDAAISSLEQADSHAQQEEVRHVAYLRRARLLILKEQYKEAEKLLMQQHPESFNVLYEELKGDLYVAMDYNNRARQAYDSAIEYAGVNVDQRLKLKRSALGRADRESVEQGGTSAQ